MALPLPSVVADTQAGGPLVTAMQGMNALNQQNADTALKNAQAYWMPYQYKMQALSSPMLWMAAKDNPALQSQLMSLLSNPMSGMGGTSGGMPGNIGGMNGGILNYFLQKITGQNPTGTVTNALLGGPFGQGNTNAGGTGANPIASSALQTSVANNGNATGTPLVPATKGGAAGAVGSLTAKMTEQPYTSGTQIPDPNNPGGTISVPTGGMTDAAQRSLLAVQRVTPIVQRLAQEAAPFMTAQGRIENAANRVKNFVAGGTSAMPSAYAKFHSDLSLYPESLLKAYGLNLTDQSLGEMKNVLDPIIGETGPSYSNRILSTLEQIKQEQQGITQHALQQGFPLPSQNQAANTNQASTTTPQNFDVNKFLSQKFANRDEFRSAVKSYTPDIQQQIFDTLKSRKK